MIIPQKLKKDDEIRLIAPAMSIRNPNSKTIKLATKRLENMGFKISFGKNVTEIIDVKFHSNPSAPIDKRIEDLHEAFADKNVRAILCISGGFNSNQLLSYIDWNLIKKNPKIICGYSDVTALNNAIYAKTGLITYIGPIFCTFGRSPLIEFTEEYFKKCLCSSESFEIKPSLKWSERDPWYEDEHDRNFDKNEGYKVINSGKTKGKILGGNLCTFNLLKGTEFMPSLKDAILFLEDDDLAGKFLDSEFDRNLQSLLHLPDFKYVKGIVIGRFQKAPEVTFEKISYIIKSKKELKNIPVVCNVDFGHTSPMITFPIGRIVEISLSQKRSLIRIIK